MFLGIRLVIYLTIDLEANKAWWKAVLGMQPYFNQPHCSSFSVTRIDLGLDPNAATEGLVEPISYWGVANMDEAVQKFVATGASVKGDVKVVGGGIKVAVIYTPTGGLVGINENPHFGEVIE